MSKWLVKKQASFPQAPYDPTTNGTQSSSLHLVSLEECFLSSVVCAATPVVTLASKRVVGLSGNVADKSEAAGLPMTPFGTERSAGEVWL